jgi:hypothetical protein
MIQLPGSDPQPAPELPVDMLDPQPADVVDGGQPLEGTDEPVQVAGVAGALKGVIGRVLKKGEKAAGAGTEAATDAEKAATAAAPPAPPNVPPAAPQPVAPPPAPKPQRATTEKIKQGVIERSTPDVPEAQGIASEMTSGAKRTVEPGRTGWRNFRSDKLATTDDIKALIDDVAEKTGGNMEARRGVVTNAQTNQEAQQYGIEELLGRKPAEAWNAAQLSAGREILLELSSRISSSAKLIDAGRATPEDMLAFRQMLGTHAAVQETLQGAVAEAGRALQIMRSVTAAGGRLRSKQVLEALDLQGGPQVTQKLAQQIAQVGGDPVKLAAITKRSALARTNDALTEIWINGLLYGPQTHGVNMSSNALTILMQIPERLTAGGIGKVSGLVDGRTDHVMLGEAGAQLFGMLSGFRDGLSAFAKTARTGMPSDAAAKIETAERKAVTSKNFGLDEDSAMGKAVDLFGEYYVRIPGRALMAEDELFKAIGYRMELQATAYRQAAQEGLTGKALSQRVDDLVRNPPEDLHIGAEQFQRYITFSENLHGDNWIQSLGQAGQKIASLPLGRFVLPFVRTPTNIAQYAIERTPLAPSLKTWRDDVAAGGARRDLALARTGLGSTMAALVAAEAATGRITGGGPSNLQEKEALKASGWQPYSVLIDGKYYGYNRLDPMGAIVGMAADAVDTLQYAEEEDSKEAVAGAVVLGFADALMSKTYLQGLSSLLDVISHGDREKTVTRWASGQAASLEPAWLNFIRRTQDDTIRDPSTADIYTQTIHQFKNRTPGLSTQIPPKLDVWGEPVKFEAGALSPVAISTQKPDPETAELLKNRIHVSKAASAVSVPLGKNLDAKVDLLALDKSGWLYHDYRQRAGRLAKRAVGSLIDSADWKDIPTGRDSERADLVEKVVRDARREALLELMADRPELEEAAIAALENPTPMGGMPMPPMFQEMPQ